MLADFSMAAACYETHAVPQCSAAHDLLAFTGAVAPRTILELGCGTGLYTRLLLAAFPQATLVGVDIAAAMVAMARQRIADARASFQVADAEGMTMGSYDLITSNATVQWFTDLPGTLTRLMGLLNEGGLLSFSFFGPETYRELDQALQDVCGEEVRVTSRRFADETVLAACLRAACTHWQMETRTYTQTFPTLKALLASIKYTGTRGRRNGSPVAWTSCRLAQIEQAYRDRTGEIRASYQVMFCTGWR
ncbi:MAG: methyltransferase domain-containing protein [Armatimonadota bacterium]